MNYEKTEDERLALLKKLSRCIKQTRRTRR